MVTTDDLLELNNEHSLSSTSYHNKSSLFDPHDKSHSTIQYPQDENVERGNWSGKYDFILSLLGYAVGLDNVWWFPYLCYRYGGGAFLIPYTIMLVFVGVPLFYMELALGQFSGSGPLTCWEFAPLFKGIGIAQLIVNAFVGIYYNMIIAWSLFYLVASFIHVTELPWSTCNNDWNTPMCYDRLPDVPCNTSRLVQYSNGTCYNTTGSLVGLWDKQLFTNTTGLKRVLASDEYYNRRVLRLSSGIDSVGPVMWDLALSLLLAWLVCFLCMVKGIKTTGKVVYVTSIFPYIVLTILFVRGVSLPHAIDGIIYYLKPDFTRLTEARIWNDAALHIFFSMSNCWGGLIALASYNKFHNNFQRDTVIVTVANFANGFVSGFVLFGFLGFVANATNTSIKEVIDSGSGLPFVVYPDAVAKIPLSHLWAILFFLMLIALGLDTEFAGLEAVLTSILDQCIFLRPYKTFVIFLLCVFFFLLGLPLCTTSGSYWLQIMDSYCSGWALLTIALVESIAVSWVYGCSRLYDDIRVMLGHRPSVWWRINLQFITPAFIIFLLIFNWANYKSTTHGHYIYPTWADVIGWLMSFFVVMMIPVYAIYRLCKETDDGFLKRLRNLTIPTVYWGPAVVKHRMLIDYVDGFQVDPWSTAGFKPRDTLSTSLDFRLTDSNASGLLTNSRTPKLSFAQNASSDQLTAGQSGDTVESAMKNFTFESAV